MGKRQHKRYRIDLPAIVALEDDVRLDCRIQNFSYGGLFLIASNNCTLDIPPGRAAGVRIPTGKDSQVIRTTTVHASNDGLGVAFVNQENGFLRYLQRVATDDHLRQKRNESTHSKGKMGTRETAIVNWILSSARRFLQSRYSEFIKSAHNALFDAANKAESDQTQNLLFDAYNALSKRQNKIEQLFLENVNSRFGSGSLYEDRPAEAEHNDSEMELVAKKDFEEWVAVVSLTRNMESETFAKLHRLENSLSFIAKRYITDDKNPVSPYSLLWSFRKSLAQLEISLQAKKVIFSAFRENMLADIAVLYDEINLYLEKQGISQQAQNETANELKKPSPAQTKSYVHAGDSDKLMNDTLSSLLGVIGNKQIPKTAKLSTEEIASREAIVKSLANISTTGQRPIIQKIEEQLSGGKTDGRPRIIDNATRQTILVTEQLLGSLQQDSYINPEIQGLIDSLKVPLLKEAINDPSLLNDANHPGHKLLDTIGKLGPYLPKEEHGIPATGSLYQAIEEVSRLTEQGTQLDINQITGHLEKIIDQRKSNLKNNLGILTQSCEQDEQYQYAKKYVFKLLCSKLTHTAIPIVIEQLLHLGWGGLLVHTISTFGQDDKNTIRLSGVIDLLLDTFNSEHGMKKASKTHNAYLIKVIKEGFSKYPVHADAASQYLARLEEILASAGSKHPTIANKRVNMDQTHIKQLLDAQTTPQPKDISDSNIEKSWLDLVNGIKLDDWIVEQRQQGHARMLNLAWKNRTATRYVFVDGEGKKRLDTGQHNLANMFKRQQCSLLEDGNIPIVERAVDRLLKNTFEQIKKESDSDGLTGLLRRNAFQKKISDLLEITSDVGDQHIMLKLDIDQFSAVNEVCGHKGGDRLLQTVANIISNYLPENATLARIGSDEFGVLIQNCSLDEGYHVAETQRRALENLRFTWDGTAIPATASVGMAHIDADSRSTTEVMNMASVACQSALDDGGNCTRIYQITDQETEQQNRIIPTATNIEDTLNGQKLSLFAQPISAVFLGDNDEHHYEILLRIKSDEGSWIGPDDFIHAAEKCHRMRSVDRWIINKIFAWLNNHHTEINNTGISINLSAQTMDDETFFTFIKDHLDRSPFPCSKVTFEITETTLIKHIDKAKTLVEKIRDKGCKFSLDDFGTGYASYSYLKDFPVDYVKIDGAFIKDILIDGPNYAMVKSITEISHHMGKQVVAEYVESEAVLVALRELEVDFAQGHYIGQPVPLKKLLPADL